MTRALSFTKASIKRRIEAIREAGLSVTGITADGTVLTGPQSKEEPQDNEPPGRKLVRL
jgi:biotin operon repressor